jgi:hypothetical protein
MGRGECCQADRYYERCSQHRLPTWPEGVSPGMQVSSIRG